MAKKTRSFGSGMTAKNVTMSSDEDIGPSLQKSAKAWNDKFESGSGAYGAVVHDVVAWAKDILENEDATAEQDTPYDYAQRILQHHKIISAAIDQGDAGKAARFAVSLGAFCAEAEIKHYWEPHALRGLDFVPKGKSPEGLYQVAEQIYERLGTSLPPDKMLKELHCLAQKGHPIIQEVDFDGEEIHWLSTSGVEKKPTKFDSFFAQLYEVKRRMKKKI
jgi:hypothetical protein